MFRFYQESIFNQITSSSDNVICQLETGAGKTRIEAALCGHYKNVIVIAHRNILIQQISSSLAELGISHNTISTEYTRRKCIKEHAKTGKNLIDRSNKTTLVASIQSLISAYKRGKIDINLNDEWLIVIDEAHHVTADNIWGMIAKIINRHRLVGFTATPARMDGESLHVSKGGLFDRLIQADGFDEKGDKILTELGYLSRCKVYAAMTSYKLSDYAEGEEVYEMMDYIAQQEAELGTVYDDLSRPVFADSAKKLNYESGILELIGHPVEEYKLKAEGSQAILMAPSIKNAEKFASEFREAGIPAACIHSGLGDVENARIINEFKLGRIKVITNVDMIGEGADFPFCRVLIIATKTASFPRYKQWCGRVRRPSDNYSIIIDLTGMCAAHGMPDDPVKWDLINPPCGPLSPRHVPCEKCGLFYKIKLDSCPDCGSENRWLRANENFKIGTYEFTIKVVDRKYRDFLIREKNKVIEDARFKTELIKNYAAFGDDLIGRTVSKISDWFIKSIVENGVPIEEANKFIGSETARNKNFFMSKFTVADLNKNNEKAMRVYREWLKSKP